MLAFLLVFDLFSMIRRNQGIKESIDTSGRNSRCPSDPVTPKGLGGSDEAKAPRGVHRCEGISISFVPRSYEGLHLLTSASIPLLHDTSYELCYPNDYANEYGSQRRPENIPLTGIEANPESDK